LSWVGKGQAILVFSAFGFSVGKNQMCLTERWLFTLTHNVPGISEVAVHSLYFKNGNCYLVKNNYFKWESGNFAYAVLCEGGAPYRVWPLKHTDVF